MHILLAPIKVQDAFASDKDFPSSHRHISSDWVTLILICKTELAKGALMVAGDRTVLATL